MLRPCTAPSAQGTDCSKFRIYAASMVMLKKCVVYQFSRDKTKVSPYSMGAPRRAPELLLSVLSTALAPRCSSGRVLSTQTHAQSPQLMEEISAETILPSATFLMDMDVRREGSHGAALGEKPPCRGEAAEDFQPQAITAGPTASCGTGCFRADAAASRNCDWE